MIDISKLKIGEKFKITLDFNKIIHYIMYVMLIKDLFYD